jgi:hypothetical protein
MTNIEQIAAGLTPEQIHILRHSLGVPDAGQTNMYRNHFVTGEGSVDHPDCIALTKMGFMRRHKGNVLTGGDDAFTVTEEGKKLVRAHLLDTAKEPTT